MNDAFELCAEDSWKPLGQQGDQTSQLWGRSTLSIHWKDGCWSWSSSILVIWCEQTTHWKSPWCWERLRAEGEKGIRGWDGWTASVTKWRWTWTNFGRWWGTGRRFVLQSKGSQRVGHDWATEHYHRHQYKMNVCERFNLVINKGTSQMLQPVQRNVQRTPHI